MILYIFWLFIFFNLQTIHSSSFSTTTHHYNHFQIHFKTEFFFPLLSLIPWNHLPFFNSQSQLYFNPNSPWFNSYVSKFSSKLSLSFLVMLLLYRLLSCSPFAWCTHWSSSKPPPPLIIFSISFKFIFHNLRTVFSFLLSEMHVTLFGSLD